MALNASKIPNRSSKFKRPEPLEPGTYPCRVVQILSLGLQPQNPYKGEPKDPAEMLYVTYEFLDEFMKDDETGEDIEDKPRWLSEDFPLHSLNADLAKSTKRYFALDPDNEYGGDWSKLGGVPCMTTVVNNPGKGQHAGKVFENITGVSTMRAKEAAKAPELKNPPKIFDIDEPDMEIFGSLPEWLQDRMTKENLRFEGSALQKALEGASQGQEGESGATPPKKGKKAAETPPQDEPEANEEDTNDDW